MANVTSCTIGIEALRRLETEAAFARGERIEACSRARSVWGPAFSPRWDWVNFDYRVAEPTAPKRTAAEICTEIEKLVAELRSVTE